METKHVLQTNRLRELRIAKGLTQKQVAQLLGKQCEDRISHWENGEAIPGIENLFKLCEIYEVAPMEVYSFRL